MATTGKRAGQRHSAAAAPGSRRRLLLTVAGVVACVAAWAFLVYAAVDFGRTARGGDGSAWVYLGVASLGAIACLFAGLLLVVRLMRALGVIAPDAGIPRVVGGRRAKR